jgi:plasmid stability protein
MALEVVMSDLVIRDIDPETFDFLRRRAEALGRSVEKVAEEILRSMPRLSPPSPEDDAKISDDELRQRQRIAGEVAALRGRTLKPLSADSTIVIRDTRDRR